MRTRLEKLLASPALTNMVLLLFPLLLYAGSVFSGFSPIDENWLIHGNTGFLGDWSNLLGSFTKAIQESYYRPLLVNSFIIDYHISATDPLMYHLSNILLHTLSVLLLFRFLGLLGIDRSIAFLLSLLFAAHPLAVHAVAWIPGRNDVLLTIFSLLSFNQLLRYLRSGKSAFLFGHGLSFAAALFTKETAMVLPLIYVLMYWSLPQPKKFFGLLIPCWLLTVALWYYMRSQVLQGFPAESRPFLPAFGDFCLALMSFCAKAVLPVIQSVSPLAWGRFGWINLVILLALVLLIYRVGLKNKKTALLGVSIFYLGLALSTWFGAQSAEGVHYEHRAYLSLVGATVFFSQLKLHPSSRAVRYGLLLLLLFFTGKTLLRQLNYQNESSYLQEGLRDSPNNHFFHYQKALMLYQVGDYQQSILHFDRAIALWPNQVNLYNNRGNAHFKLKHKEQTLADYTRALELSNYKTSIYLTRCMAYKEFGEIYKAKEDLENIKRRHPEVLPKQVETEINTLWLQQQITDLSALISKHPDDAKAYVQRAQVYFYLRKGPEALADLKEACRLEPSNKTYRAYYEKLLSTYPHK